MKKNLKKFICAIILIITIFNVFFPLVSSAVSNPVAYWWSDDPIGIKVLDGVVALMMWPFKVIPYAIARVSWDLLSAFTTGGEDKDVTPEDIIFSGSSKKDGIKFLDINFFDTNKSDDSTVNQIRKSIAKGYYTMRNVAIAASLVVLIYVGIRMAISSVAETKAKYKEMFKDWLVGFIMLFVLHYIMVATIYINNALVDLIQTLMEDTGGGLTSVTEDIEDIIWGEGFIKGFGALIVWITTLGVTVAFFIQYIKRFFTVGFLIVISPLITVTYSVDKMGDGKSQALNTWLKEFIFNIVIQPFHCIIYAILCSTAVKALDGTTSLKNFVIAIMSMLFVFSAEKIVKNIFGIQAQSLGETAAAGALAWGVMSKFQSKAQNKNAKAAGSVGGGSSTSDFKRKQSPGDPNNPTTGPFSSNNNVPGTLGRAANKAKGAISNSPIGAAGRAIGRTAVAQAVAKAGQAVGNTVKDSALGKEISDFAKDRAEDWKEFATAPLKNTIQGVKKLTLKQIDNAVKFTPKIMTGAFAAGATGSVATGIGAGYVAGNTKLGQKASEFMEKDIHKLQENAYAKRVANAMDNYRIDNDNMSDEDIYNKCLDLYEKDISTLTDPAEKQLAKRLQELKKLYEDRGEGDPAQRVMHQVERIQAGNIRNAIKVKTENIISSAENIMNNLHRSKGEIIDPNPANINSNALADTIIDNINDNVRNKNDYFKSASYSSLAEEEKELAKQIYTSKSMMSAIGSAPQARVDAEIKRALREQLH